MKVITLSDLTKDFDNKAPVRPGKAGNAAEAIARNYGRSKVYMGEDGSGLDGS
jgi:hypothetical protein